MKITDNGGPAFPHTFQTMGAPLNAEPGKPVMAEPVTVVAHGMSMRDYFAAHAPIRLNDARDYWFEKNGRHYGNDGSIVKPTMDDIMTTLALMRGLYADSMIAERAR